MRALLPPARRLAGAVLACGLLAWSWAAAGAEDRARPPGATTARPGVKPPSPPASRGNVAPRAALEYLPDSTILARVNDRGIRVKDFVLAYFRTSPDHRPRPDSAGRAEFLETMVTKEVIARVARAAKRPEGYEDRGIMRAYSQRVLSNVLYQRSVLDSVRVSEADADSIAAQMRRQLRLDRMRFGSRQTAERVRADLVAKRMSWARAAALRVPIPGDNSASGDIGWRTRAEVPAAAAPLIFGLPVGGISPVLVEASVYALYRVVEEKPFLLSTPGVLRPSIIDELRQRQTTALSERLLAGLRAEIDMRYDTVNVLWASARFPTKVKGEGSSYVSIDLTVPVIPAADSGRVVATYRGGQVTVGRILDEYKATEDFLRPDLSSVESVRRQIDVLVLEPRMAEVARERGLERDSMAVAMIANRREEMMVDHLYQDSIMARVFVPPAERRKYYKDNEYKFVRSASARYAVFQVGERAEADTLEARLKHGIQAEDIIRADSLQGFRRGYIESRSQDEHGRPFHRMLFEEMRPREVAVVGQQEGGFTVLQLLERDSGRAVSFEEADAQIDDYLQQEVAEKLLAAFVARHKRHMKIESHPERVMRIRLEDPSRS